MNIEHTHHEKTAKAGDSASLLPGEMSEKLD